MKGGLNSLSRQFISMSAISLKSVIVLATCSIEVFDLNVVDRARKFKQVISNNQSVV